MNCKKCGALLNSQDKFCGTCGCKVDEIIVQNQTVNNNYMGQPNMVQPNMVQPISTSSENGAMWTISLILSIVSIVFSFFVSALAIPIGIVGIILACCSKCKAGKKVIVIILSVIGIVISTLMILLGAIVLSMVFGKNTFDCNGYNISYDYSWRESVLTNGDPALVYGFGDSYLAPLGKTTLSEFTDELDCSFAKDSCKKKMADTLYDEFEVAFEERSYTMKEDIESFKELTKDFYYYSFYYDAEGKQGKFYILVNEEENVVLSLISRAVSVDEEEFEEAVLEVLKTINIYDDDVDDDGIISGFDKDDDKDNEKNNDKDVEDENKTDEEENEPVEDENDNEDEKVSEMLDSMRAWNRYSDLRHGSLGTKVTLDGGWRILSNSETYWVFKNGEFWWYKSLNDLDDNYWYGTTRVITGKEGLKEVGLDENKLDSIILNSNGLIDENDVYAVICKPIKIIADGVDMSDTNIAEDSSWPYVWILVDHGSEGIEAQTLNMLTYSTSYFVKVQD